MPFHEFEKYVLSNFVTALAFELDIALSSRTPAPNLTLFSPGLIFLSRYRIRSTNNLFSSLFSIPKICTGKRHS